MTGRRTLSPGVATPFLIALAGCSGEAPSPLVTSVEISPPAIHFSVIGDSLPLSVQAYDAAGNPAPAAVITLVTRNPDIVALAPGNVVRAISNGVAYIVAHHELARPDSVRVSVAQVVDTLLVELTAREPIVAVPLGGSVPLSCRFFDNLGQLVPVSVSVQSRHGLVQGTSCDGLTAHGSGFDTLDLGTGINVASFPVAVAIRPTLASLPDSLAVSGVPAGLEPWAPTLRRNSAGELELYFTAFFDSLHVGNPIDGNLVRMKSPDGVHFTYDGVALAKFRRACHPEGTGIENISIVPRADAAGWRMFYAAGGNECYGWQVLSAVSDNERTWSREPGVRVDNGGSFPPALPVNPPWPAGEGIEIDQLATGEWRMLVGAYERVTPPDPHFQIVEWRSPDQLAWHYVGPVLTTRQVGPEAQRSIYSPSIREIRPGLHRMIFTGDDMSLPGGSSRIYTAVSLDRRQWQVEGVLVADPEMNFLYSTAVDDLLIFILQRAGVNRILGSVKILTR